MNAPRADRVAAIATELGLLGRRLDALAGELSAWQPSPEPVEPRAGSDTTTPPVGVPQVRRHRRLQGGRAHRLGEVLVD